MRGFGEGQGRDRIHYNYTFANQRLIQKAEQFFKPRISIRLDEVKCVLIREGVPGHLLGLVARDLLGLIRLEALYSLIS